MTWFASGTTFGQISRGLDQDGAIREALLEPFRDLGVLLTDNVTQAAVLRAADRWEGEGATPFLSRRDGQDRPAPLVLDSETDRTQADSAFATFVVRPGTEELTLTFFDDGLNMLVTSFSDQPEVARAVLGGEEDSYVLVDAFIGDSTVRSTALARVRDGVAHVRLRLGGRVAVLLGTRIRVAAERRAARDRDPFWEERLARLESDPKHAALAEKHPQLKNAPKTDEPIAVLVHGTFSSCVPVLADVSGHVGDTPLYRFEHDTTRPVTANAGELLSLLTHISSPHVTLIGHSRGGLVATLVSAQLDSTKNVITLGTPHRGTDVVSSIDNLLGYAAAAAGTQIQSILDGGMQAAQFASALPPGHVPDGWSDMMPHGSFINTLALLDRSTVTAYGGKFDGAQAGLGTGPHLASLAMADAFKGDHDLVVPTDSSKPDDLDGAVLPQVHHFNYFEDSTVGQAISDAVGGP